MKKFKYEFRVPNSLMENGNKFEKNISCETQGARSSNTHITNSELLKNQKTLNYPLLPL